MPTIHFRKEKQVVALFEQPETRVPSLVAELAEALVSTKLATQNDVAELRLGVEQDDGFTDITESTASLLDLCINEHSTVCFKFGKEASFGCEAYA